MSVKRLTRLGLMVVVALQLVVYILAGFGKSYIHMDEAFSLGLAQYHAVDITHEADFYNQWHDREYYQDYLAVQDDKRGDYTPVYRNQRDDVHSPFYYLLLRTALEMGPREFSKWPGIILNMLIAVANTVVLFLLMRELLGKTRFSEQKTVIFALILTAVAGLTIAAVSAVVYIRMYMLLTLFVTLTAWLHVKLYTSSRRDLRLLAAIGLTAVFGVLTQYYYLFFLAPVWVVMVSKYLTEKRYRDFWTYTGVLMMAGGVALVVWPYMIDHMFFGYRGQGVLMSFLSLPKLMGQIWHYVEVMDYNAFHRLLPVLLLMMVGCAIWRRLKAKQQEQTTSLFRRLGKWNVVLWPTLGYFLIVAAVSPFIELRYIMPVTGLVTAMMFLGVYIALRSVRITEKVGEAIVGGLMLLMLVLAPIQLMMGAMRIELLYRDKEALMMELSENATAPVLYLITTENNRFLDNIMPFATFEESYLALDIEPTVAEVKQIMAGKDLSQGMYLFVSGVMDQGKTLAVVQQATGLTEVRYVRGVNTCEIYYLR